MKDAKNSTRVWPCQFFGGSLDGETRSMMGLWDDYPVHTLRLWFTGEFYDRRAVARGYGIGWIYELREEDAG